MKKPSIWPLVLVILASFILIIILGSKIKDSKSITKKTSQNLIKTTDLQTTKFGLKIINPTVFAELKTVENGIIQASSENPQIAVTRTTYKGRAEITLSDSYFNLKPNVRYPTYQSDCGEVIVFIEAENFPYAKIVRLRNIKLL